MFYLLMLLYLFLRALIECFIIFGISILRTLRIALFCRMRLLKLLNTPESLSGCPNERHHTKPSMKVYCSTLDYIEEL